MTRLSEEQPENADLISQRVNQPFAQRSVSAFFMIILFIGAIVAVIYFFTGSDSKTANNGEVSGQENSNVASLPLDDIPGQDLDNAILRAANKFFDASDVLPKTRMESMADIETYYNQASEKTTEYQDSFYSFLDSDINDPNGQKIGYLHDVIIDKNTGEAKAIIVDEEDAFFGTNLEVLTFQDIAYQESDGDVRTSITENNIEQRDSFNYADITDNDFISLKNLRNGQVLDDKGKYVGEIDALIYRNAEINNIYFTIRTELTNTANPVVIKYPFEQLNIIKNIDGYDVQLTTEETRDLAAMLLSE